MNQLENTTRLMKQLDVNSRRENEYKCPCRCITGLDAAIFMLHRRRSNPEFANVACYVLQMSKGKCLWLNCSYTCQPHLAKVLVIVSLDGKYLECPSTQKCCARANYGDGPDASPSLEISVELYCNVSKQAGFQHEMPQPSQS